MLHHEAWQLDSCILSISPEHSKVCCHGRSQVPMSRPGEHSPKLRGRIREEPRKPAINQQESTKEGGLAGIDSGSMQLMLISRHFQD
jgi:hypothetical protein